MLAIPLLHSLEAQHYFPDLLRLINCGFISGNASKWELTTCFFGTVKKDRLLWSISWKKVRLFGRDLSRDNA